jgi:hypothetical protein
VKPAAEYRTRPADDILVLILPAGLAVGSEAHDVVFAMLAWRGVLVVPPPRILRNLALGQVRAVPSRRVRRFLHQCLQAFRSRRQALVVEAVEIQRIGKAGDLELGCLGLRAAEVAEHPRRDESGQKTQDDQDDQQLHQGEPG